MLLQPRSQTLARGAALPCVASRRDRGRQPRAGLPQPAAARRRRRTTRARGSSGAARSPSSTSTRSTGPSWKPLPVIVTTLTAPLGEASPYIWVAVARAGAIAAVALAFLLAARLAGTGRRRRRGRRASALMDWHIRNGALGNSEGLMVALVLGAVLAHLQRPARAGRSRWRSAPGCCGPRRGRSSACTRCGCCGRTRRGCRGSPLGLASAARAVARPGAVGLGQRVPRVGPRAAARTRTARPSPTTRRSRSSRTPSSSRPPPRSPARSSRSSSRRRAARPRVRGDDAAARERAITASCSPCSPRRGSASSRS